MVNCMANVTFQLSELFAYLNTEILKVDQKGFWIIEIGL